MGYEEIVNALYMHLIETPGFDMCGPVSREAMHEFEAVLEEHPDLEPIEDLMTAGFEENATNGFRHGFQCAAALLLGSNKIYKHS